MNKAVVIKASIEYLEQQYLVLENAARQAHNDATHEESVAETQYDTLGLEAAFLAQGQSNRAQQIHQDILYFKNLLESQVNTEIQVSKISTDSLVRLVNENDEQATYDYLIVKQAGGFKLCINDKTVWVISQQSPMAKRLMGLTVEDDIEIRVNQQAISTYIAKIQ
ncbi:GreA/GreB family elongation factor [Catenovulum sp. SM1970]|uniref:GreA/GreB family elongation factor n=1 Tax=Marinifaba aquimaris TaxID=2741323 RepID=UPI001573F92A|nr:GreA/GreB family elongation factor [Marinifaba aquimaris]NTS78558.1 GreA/GreB family elongation factor [Marinifaba aquimaris]